MKGIILLNRQIYSGDVKGEIKFLHDTGNLMHVAKEQQIEVVKLNPDYLNIFYTIPFALHFDLKKVNKTFDYLLIHSAAHFEDFRQDYGEYWEAIRSHFTYVMEAERHMQQEISLFAEEVQELPPTSNL